MLEKVIDYTKKLEFIKNYTIENDRNYKLGNINKFEWLEERAKIFTELLTIESELQ